MTIVFSTASARLITMTADSAVAHDFSDRREYATGGKAFPVPGVGCVTTWGARDHNRLGAVLTEQRSSPSIETVSDLTALVQRYLNESYRPRELGLDDVGYHIAGFDQEEQPHLSHVFWGFDRPKSPEQTSRKYERYDHSPKPGGIQFLYSGRNDLADMLVKKLLSEIREGRDTRFDLATDLDRVLFGDFVVRFAAELTPEVGPPFYTILISPKNQIRSVKNEVFCPVPAAEVVRELERLEIEA